MSRQRLRRGRILGYTALVCVAVDLGGCAVNETGTTTELCFDGCSWPQSSYFALDSVPPSSTTATVGVGTYKDGRVFVNGVLYQAALGASYVLHIHSNGCGGPNVAYALGPARGEVVASRTTAAFPSVEVTASILDGSYSADVHLNGQPTVLACGALR